MLDAVQLVIAKARCVRRIAHEAPRPVDGDGLQAVCDGCECTTWRLPLGIVGWVRLKCLRSASGKVQNLRVKSLAWDYEKGFSRKSSAQSVIHVEMCLCCKVLPSKEKILITPIALFSVLDTPGFVQVCVWPPLHVIRRRHSQETTRRACLRKTTAWL